jgi:hypothetical protein
MCSKTFLDGSGTPSGSMACRFAAPFRRKRKCSYDNHRDHAGKPPPRRQQDREVLIP